MPRARTIYYGAVTEPPPKPSPDSKPLMRSLGEFFGHVWKGVKSDPGPPRQVVRREVQEKTVATPGGEVVLRRTTVDEVEVRKPKA